MDIFQLSPDFSVLLLADSLPLPPDLETLPQVMVTSVRAELSSPSGYLHQYKSILTDTSPQRRIDEFSITPVPPRTNNSLVGVSRSGQENLPPLQPTPQSKWTQPPPTDSESLDAEDIESDSEIYYTPLEIAEAKVHLALERNAPKKIVKSLRDKVRYERATIKKQILVSELEANLPPEQIASIRTESQKSTPSKEEKYDRVMRYLKSRPNDPLTRKYTPEGLCAAIVDNKKNAFTDLELRQFHKFRKKVISGYSSFKSRRIAKEYVRLLKEANEIET